MANLLKEQKCIICNEKFLGAQNYNFACTKCTPLYNELQKHFKSQIKKSDEKLFSNVYEQMGSSLLFTKESFDKSFSALNYETKTFFREVLFFIEFIANDNPELGASVREKLHKYFNEVC